MKTEPIKRFRKLTKYISLTEKKKKQPPIHSQQSYLMMISDYILSWIKNKSEHKPLYVVDNGKKEGSDDRLVLEKCNLCNLCFFFLLLCVIGLRPKLRINNPEHEPQHSILEVGNQRKTIWETYSP